MQNSRTAVITGASVGIGAEFARQLAAAGYDLILVARRQQLLEQLADELCSRYGVKATPYVCDLVDRSQLEQLAAAVERLDDLHLLVNNAGFGTTETIAAADPQQQIAMLQLHMVAPYLLCHAALQPMLRRAQTQPNSTPAGAIINVSSTAAFFTGVSAANYSASKAYLNSFSQSLQAEVKPYAISVQALCPGYTVTEFHDTEPMTAFSRRNVPGFMWDSAEFVVRTSLQQLHKDKVIVIPGWFYRSMIFASRTPFSRVIGFVARRIRRRR